MAQEFSSFSHLENVHPFLIQKWNHAFNIFFDINKNNFMEWADFEQLLEIIRVARGEDSDDYRGATETMKKIFEEMLQVADLNQDEKVSVEEWQHMWFNWLKSKELHNWQKLYLDYMFKLLDSSGDEFIDLSEYIGVMDFFGIPREAATDSFDKFARNCDGQHMYAIDYKTYCRLWNEYFESTDPDSPGNFLFGEIESN